VGGRIALIILIAEIVIPITPVIAAVIAEEEIAETFRVGILGGDPAEVFYGAGGDGLSLIVFCGELGGDGGGADRWRGNALGDFKGIAAEFLDAQRDFETGAFKDLFAFAPVVLDGLCGGEFVGKFQSDRVGAGFDRGEFVGEIE
jgi:hypothetical protein